MGDTDSGPVPPDGGERLLIELSWRQALKVFTTRFDPTTIAVIAINGMVLVAFLAFLWFLKTL